MNHRHYGNFMAALSFVIWGLLPVYYRFLPNAAMAHYWLGTRRDSYRLRGDSPLAKLVAGVAR